MIRKCQVCLSSSDPAYDTTSFSAMTVRSFSLGLVFCILASAANTFFHFRTPSIFISPFMIQVIVYPFGKLAAYSLPITTHHLPKFLGGAEWSLNPGPFNIKEHTLIVMMANVAIGPAYALYATVSSELWYNRNMGAGFTILLIMATRLTGFCFAGLSRRFVVWPASMVWPNNLVVATTLNTFHAEDEGSQGGISRFRFLIYVGSGAFVWMFLPGNLPSTFHDE
jgi:OPT family oligopeptide transporter